jgi:two-component system, sensor histidine kinase and response regulator
MRLFGNSSIRRQLTLVVLCTSLFGLSIVCTVFELYERASFRRALTEELSALADTVGANSAASLTFNDRKSAEEVLAGLGAEHHVIAACLYNTSGQAFAEYRRPGIGQGFLIPLSQEDGAHFAQDALTLRRGVSIEGERVGSIAIVSDLKELQAKMREYTEISALALFLSVLATLFISSRLLRLITEPILQLADVAGKVSSEENYALRAIPHNNDEVGRLIRSFNGMLERIQERDTKLKEAKDDLELRVEARTKELQLEIAERVRAQEALSEERQVLRALIDNVPDHMYVKDADCRFIVANAAVARQMGAKSTDELLGKTDFDFYPRELATTFIEDEQKVIRSGRAEINREETGLDSEGNVSQVLTTQVPLRDKNGKVTGLAGIGHDITHLKKIQAEMQRARDVAEGASHAKSDFLANMSHEIRTPLNGIMGMTDLALETELSPEQREYLETVKFSADSLLKVINDILDFSKIEAGKVDLESADFDLRDSVESALKTLAVRADEKGLELLCEVAPEVPEVVRGDATRLRQVVLNLVGNAIKFTNEGEIAVKVQQEAKDGHDLLLHFTVSDTGIGIPEKKQELIFDPFAQADSSTTRKYGGTGLGLTISARLVQMMGGRIWAESEVGRGSRFHFTVRLQVTDRKEIKVGSPAPPEMLRGVRVLVVDDNRTNLRILEGMLKRWEMIPVCVEGGEQALIELASARNEGRAFMLIVTDMHMPKMDGFELVKHIRERPELCTATIMMLTSAGHRGDAERCQKLGVSAYLLKPIRQSELREAIAKVLGAREQEGRIPLITRYSLGDARDRSEVLRILVAEDNLVNQRLIVRLLEKRGHRVAVAGNGQEALAAMEKESFDIVLMDVQMPDMDGFEATAAIRSKEKSSGLHQTIVALTAHAMKGDREKCLAGGMDGYLTKPIRPQELDEVLARYGARPHVTA